MTQPARVVQVCASPFQPGNSEADALTNWNFNGFDPAPRYLIDSTNMDWALLPKVQGTLLNRLNETEEART